MEKYGAQAVVIFCQSDMERTTPRRKSLLYSFDRALGLPNSPQTVWYGINEVV